MIGKNTPFSITFLFKSPKEKVLLFKHGETPAKEEKEADAVLSTANEDELDDVEKVIAAVKLFSECEEGSEETLTKELQELEDEYGFTLEAVGTEEPEEIEEKEDIQEEEETNPFDVMKEETAYSFTNPYDYDAIDDEPIDTNEISAYTPILSEEEFLAEVEELEEVTSAKTPIFLSTLNGYLSEISPILYFEDLDSIFVELNVPKFSNDRFIMALASLNSLVDLYVDQSGEPFIKSKKGGISTADGSTLVSLESNDALNPVNKKILLKMVNG